MKIDRSEILTFEEYEPRREAIRARAMEEKRTRRVHLGALTFLFGEWRETTPPPAR